MPIFISTPSISMAKKDAARASYHGKKINAAIKPTINPAMERLLGLLDLRLISTLHDLSPYNPPLMAGSHNR